MEDEDKKVLVIEDDAGVARMIETIFRIGKIDAVFAVNGREGLELLEQEDIGLIICDIMLPDIIGYDILKKVKSTEETSGIPFVFLTAFADPTDKQRGLDAGADRYMTKPFIASELIKLAQEFLYTR